jgi:hypothetical protein
MSRVLMSDTSAISARAGAMACSPCRSGDHLFCDPWPMPVLVDPSRVVTLVICAPTDRQETVANTPTPIPSVIASRLRPP